MMYDKGNNCKKKWKRFNIRWNIKQSNEGRGVKMIAAYILQIWVTAAHCILMYRCNVLIIIAASNMSFSHLITRISLQIIRKYAFILIFLFVTSLNINKVTNWNLATAYYTLCNGKTENSNIINRKITNEFKFSK